MAAADAAYTPVELGAFPTTVAEMREFIAFDPGAKDIYLDSVRATLELTHSTVEPESPGFVDRKVKLLGEVLGGKEGLDEGLNIILFASKKLMEKGLATEWVPDDGDCLYTSLEITIGSEVGTLRTELAAYIEGLDPTAVVYVSKGEDGVDYDVTLETIMAITALDKSEIATQIRSKGVWNEVLGDVTPRIAAGFIAKEKGISILLIDTESQEEISHNAEGDSPQTGVVVNVGSHYVGTAELGSKTTSR